MLGDTEENKNLIKVVTVMAVYTQRNVNHEMTLQPPTHPSSK